MVIDERSAMTPSECLGQPRFRTIFAQRELSLIS